MLVHPLHRKIKFWLTLLVSIELGKGTKPAYELIRQKLNFIEFDKDIEIFEELNKASAVVESEEFLATIEKAVDLRIQY